MKSSKSAALNLILSTGVALALSVTASDAAATPTMTICSAPNYMVEQTDGTITIAATGCSGNGSGVSWWYVASSTAADKKARLWSIASAAVLSGQRIVFTFDTTASGGICAGVAGCRVVTGWGVSMTP